MPNMNDSQITERLAGLSSEQRALLFQKLKQKQTQSAPDQIGRLPRDTDALAASFAQQRLWFIDQLDPGKPWYNISRILWLAGRLDAAALERSLSDLIARHEVLRTTFALADG